MIFQPVSSIFPCSPQPSGTWRNPCLSIPWCCRPTSSSVCLVFFPLSLCLARWFWPDHTTAVCVSLRWSGLRMVLLLARSWHGLPCWTSVLLGFAKFFGWGYLSFVYWIFPLFKTIRCWSKADGNKLWLRCCFFCNLEQNGFNVNFLGQYHTQEV